MNPLGHIPEFDGIRGVLSLIVLFGHIVTAQSAENFLGWFGASMEVFFCLSGFLIAYIVLHKYRTADGFQLSAYVVNRVLRIWPAYFLSYAAALLLSLALPERFIHGGWQPLSHQNAQALVSPLFFVQNLELLLGRARAPYTELFDHSWSVAIEEQFYLLLPLSILVLLRCSRAFIGVVLASLVALSGLERAVGKDAWLITSRLDPFVFGVGLSLLYASLRAQPAELHKSVARTMAILIAVSAVLLMPWLAETYGRSPLQGFAGAVLARTIFEPIFLFGALAMGLLGYVLFGDFGGRVHRFLRWGPLQGLGQISYSTYLLHPLIVFSLVPALSTAMGLSRSAMVLLSGPLTIVLAFCSYRLIEQPFMSLRRRYGQPGH